MCKGAEEDLWVMFSDDDDLWHPKRVESYVELLEAVRLMNGGVVPREMLAAKLGRYAEGETKASTAAEVEVALATGAMRLMCMSGGAKYDDEYWMLACRLSCLHDFVKSADLS